MLPGFGMRDAAAAGPGPPPGRADKEVREGGEVKGEGDTAGKVRDSDALSSGPEQKPLSRRYDGCFKLLMAPGAGV